jgi:hypothetical protein
LAEFARALTVQDLGPPDTGRLMRPKPKDQQRLLRVH